MDTTYYTTRADAIDQEIIGALEGSADDPRAEFDIDAIADEVLDDHGQGYFCQVDTDEFWAIVERHAR